MVGVYQLLSPTQVVVHLLQAQIATMGLARDPRAVGGDLYDLSGDVSGVATSSPAPRALSGMDKLRRRAHPVYLEAKRLSPD